VAAWEENPDLNAADVSSVNLLLPRPPSGEGHGFLPGAGPEADQPVPTVVRCRERQQDVAPW
jgi:hypothetical protein